MWIIQNDILVEIPDDMPVSADAKPVDLPDGFFDDPLAFKITGDSLVRRTKAERRKLDARATPSLTADDVDRLKKAISEGRI